MNEEAKGQTPASAHPRRATEGGPATLTARVLAKLCATTPAEAEGAAEELRWLARTTLRRPLYAAGEVLREVNMVVRERLER